MTSEEAPRKESPEKTEATENTEANRWGIPWRIVGLIASGVAGFFITPYIQVGNDLTAHFIYAFMALTLYLFILLLIYLYAYKEELSGFIFKIFKTIKNFAHNIWEKLNSTKKLIRAFAIFAGLALLLLLIHNIIENSILHSEKIRNLPTGFNFSLKSNELSEIQNIRKSTFFYASGALLVALLLTLPFAKKLKFLLQEHILRIFVLTVIFGGILSFFIPAFLYNYEFIGDTKDLTTALFTITGGTIALFSLIKSHQKSELEREQLDTQKKKDARDHIRQVHSARRDRYIEAIDKLSSEYAPVRLGGVYALVGLVDEWLDDDNIDEETQLKEGQVIINNLCSYIRRPFSMADKLELFEKQTLSTPPPMIRRKKKVYSPEILQKINKDKILFKEEKEIRQTIISEIRSRLSRGLDPSGMPTPGPWSKFTYNFSGAFFYPVDFSNSYFGAPIDFGLSNFFEYVNFNSAVFDDDADFYEASFRENSFFEKSIFNADIRFQGAEFTKGTDFSQAIFNGGTDFSKSIFNGSVLFLATFCGYTTFSEATFSQDVQFTGRTFHQEVDFSKSTFKELSIFIGVFFKGKTLFNDATFTKSVNFSDATFENYEPLFASGEERAKFSVRPSQEDYNFSVRSGSKPIQLGKAELDGIERQIPVGTVLFDPSSGETSASAKPIEESDNRIDNPSK